MTKKEVITIGCYNPLLRIEDQNKWETAKDGHKYHPARILSGRTNMEDYDWLQDKQWKWSWIPCGQCIGCRLDYSREWADRGYLESQCHPKNTSWFLTLTINDESLIKDDEIVTKDGFVFTKYDIANEDDEWQGVLIPRSVELFMKRFRKYMKTHYKIEGIRYMLCGEYGTEGGRPHYHIILFNCPIPNETLFDPKPDWEKNVYCRCEIVEKLWSDPKTGQSWGFHNITEATWNTMAYVGRYITKKLKGPLSKYEMAAIGRTQEFFRVSNRPGIARKYYDTHKEEIYTNDKILILDRKGSHWVKPPGYFDKILKEENPEKWEEIQAKRQKMQLNNLLAKGEKTSLTRYEQLQVEQRTKTDSSYGLVRQL